MRLLVARHGFDELATTVNGEASISKQGKNQVSKLSKVIAKFKPDYIIHSGMKRSTETAEMLKSAGKAKVIMNALFSEMKAGTSRKEDTTDGFVTLSDRYGEGESYSEMYERVRGAWNWITTTFDLAKDERIVIIGHKRFLNFFFSYILGFNPNGYNFVIDHTSYLVFEVQHDWRPQLVLPVPDQEYI